MLEPNKYTDYKNSIINVAATIIKVLEMHGASRYNIVMKQVQNLIGENSKYEFQNSLNFLFLLGKVEYVEVEDLLEIIL
jgi:L-rhamnose mutarotase